MGGQEEAAGVRGARAAGRGDLRRCGGDAPGPQAGNLTVSGTGLEKKAATK